MADGEKGKKSSKKGKKGGTLKLIVVLVLAVGGVGAKMTILKPPPPDPHAKPVEGEVLEIDPLTVNLADGGKSHYARVGVGLVLNATAHADELKKKLALFKDSLISTVGSYQSTKLRTGAGQEELRKKLTEQAHKVYEHEAVVRVVLTEIVVD